MEVEESEIKINEDRLNLSESCCRHSTGHHFGTKGETKNITSCLKTLFPLVLCGAQNHLNTKYYGLSLGIQ